MQRRDPRNARGFILEQGLHRLGLRQMLWQAAVLAISYAGIVVLFYFEIFRGAQLFLALISLASGSMLVASALVVFGFDKITRRLNSY